MGLRDRVMHELGPVETTAGPVELPIRYWDVSVGIALFRGDRDAAAQVIEPMSLRPVVVRGDALVGLGFCEYRGTSIGPYNEVALVVLSRPERRPGLPAGVHLLLPNHMRTPGVAVLDLPVTTPGAHAAGREVWGYPKFVTELPIKFGERTFDGEVRDPDGGLICSLRGTFGRGVPFPVLDLVTYTSLHGQRWRTEITTSGMYSAHGGSDLRLGLGDSGHAMRTRLSDLGLAGTAPVTFLVSHDYRALLHAGAAG